MQNYALSANLPNFWDILHPSVTNDMEMSVKWAVWGEWHDIFVSWKCCFSAYFPSNKFRKSNIISIFAFVLVPKSIESWMWWEIFVEKRYLTLCT